MSKGSLSSQDMEEVAADTFYTLWQNSEKVNEDSLKGYIASITKTKTLDKLRSAGKTSVVELDDAILVNEYTSDNMEEVQELKYDLSQAMKMFDEQDREIILRYYYYYQTARTIGEIMGLKTENVKSKVRRARQKLAVFLKERGYEV